MSNFCMAKIGTRNQNWQKQHSCSIGWQKWNNEPKLAETIFYQLWHISNWSKTDRNSTLLACSVGWLMCHFCQNGVMQEGYQGRLPTCRHGCWFGNFRRGRTGSRRKKRKKTKKLKDMECHAFHLAQSTSDMMISTLWQHTREDVHHLDRHSPFLTNTSTQPHYSPLFSGNPPTPWGPSTPQRRHIEDDQKSTPVIALRKERRTKRPQCTLYTPLQTTEKLVNWTLLIRPFTI